MRMSADPKDRGYRNLVIGTKTFVDGIEHKRVVTADEELGVIWELIVELNGHGSYVMRMTGGATRATGGRPELREVRGKVRLVVPGKGRQAFPANPGLGVVAP
jgi:hypothetical protein